MTGRSTLIILFALALLLVLLERAAYAQQIEIETIKVDLAGCIKYDHANENHVFKDKRSLETVLRTDEYAADCNKTINTIDFEKYSVLGVNIRNAQCWGFTLEGKVFLDAPNKSFRFAIEHPPRRSACRGLTEHSLWVLAPRVPDDHSVSFEITEKEKKDESPNECRPSNDAIDG